MSRVGGSNSFFASNRGTQVMNVICHMLAATKVLSRSGADTCARGSRSTYLVKPDRGLVASYGNVLGTNTA
jgi:hypothetical protein